MTATIAFPGAKASAGAVLPVWRDRPFQKWDYWLTPDYQPIENGGTMKFTDNAKGKAAALVEAGASPRFKVVNLGTNDAPHNVWDSRGATGTALGLKVPNSFFNEAAGFTMVALYQVPAAFSGSMDLFGGRRFSNGANLITQIVDNVTNANRHIGNVARFGVTTSTIQRTAAYGQWWGTIMNVNAADNTWSFEVVDVTTSSGTLNGAAGNLGVYPETEAAFFLGGRATGTGSVSNPFVGRLKLFALKRSFTTDANELEAVRAYMRARKTALASFTI